ncbi:TetR/AcrR family transcriptional regulator [Sulfurovum sp. NBC37-1]|uniref:TetR/AcrR family transcriptional regulator n=1 Tax=Sulfurovum sp. (strain NBC37-1) TaxID=387093 RepID=UPI00015876DA|nr:TetR/AcrR family transcriptional regulator [Sulfurovum sp. NBC37-1]BAF71898.1 transcriptional regulator, TetR family [Sulfurovum sp. NBC37-1]
MKKNDYHHGNLKEEFLTIAFAFIRENDIEKLTLKVLSDATHTSRSAIYRHFSSKDALIETMIITGFDAFDRTIAPILTAKEKPLPERFYFAGRAYLDYARENPSLYRLLFGKRYAHIREEIMTLGDDCSGFGALKKAIEEGQENGLIKKENSFTQAVVVWSSLHGLASTIIDGFMDVEANSEQFYNAMYKSLLAGLLSKKVTLLSTLPFSDKFLEVEAKG